MDTKIPVTEPIRGADGTMITEVAVPKGTSIFLNNHACNGNKALWGEDAEEWKPERWLSPLPRELEKARIPGIYANLYAGYSHIFMGKEELTGTVGCVCVG